MPVRRFQDEIQPKSPVRFDGAPRCVEPPSKPGTGSIGDQKSILLIFGLQPEIKTHAGSVGGVINCDPPYVEIQAITVFRCPLFEILISIEFFLH